MPVLKANRMYELSGLDTVQYGSCILVPVDFSYFSMKTCCGYPLELLTIQVVGTH